MGLGASRSWGASRRRTKPLDRVRGSMPDCAAATRSRTVCRVRPARRVAACGNAASGDLHHGLPFILRGVRLLGADSVNPPAEERNAAWERPRRDLDRELRRRLTITADPRRTCRAWPDDILRGASAGASSWT